ncbi:hypothetical protein AOC36_05235 [Erysipelothrix larvae]|uniref:DUF695 domain-containing protein n=1 Tax=Erysipelothrix larvae TaxID=1514105 RepID=A0A0X8GZP8_9FIRM|nr:DUF695 domain-containing protein [Erysipelothrix larvae]AMC93402.1 hypothetical protein AOC36_05235 [Erysipelothrix larvae]
MSERTEFVFYPTTLDEVAHSVRVDIYAHERLEQYPHGVIVMIKYKVREDGYPSEDEFDRLSTLESSLMNDMVEHGSLYLGTITGNGSVDLFFASPTADNISEPLKQRQGDEIEVLVHPNGSESLYINYLYPNLYEQQYIVNQDYCKELLEQGEMFETARDVLLYASFHDNKSAHDFAHEFEGLTKEAHIHLSKDGHIHVHLTMHIVPDVMTMNLLTDKMIHGTESRHGHFEGWQTTVVGV